MPFKLQIIAIYLLAIGAAVFGIWLLKIAWRSPQRQWRLVFTGWALVAISLYGWSFTAASDKGVALGITAWVVIALLFLLHSAIKSPIRTQRRRGTLKPKKTELLTVGISKSQIALNTLTILIIGPLAGSAAMLFSTLVLTLMLSNVEYTANLALTTILFPTLWAGLAVALGYQQRLMARLLTVASIGFGSLLCLWLAS